MEDIAAEGDPVKAGVAILHTGIRARKEEIEIVHGDGTATSLDFGFMLFPFGKIVSELHDVGVKWQLLDCTIKGFDVGLGKGRGANWTGNADDIAIPADLGGGKATFGVMPNLFHGIKEVFGTAGNGTEIHGYIVVVKNGAPVFAQVIAVGQIEELQCDELGNVVMLGVGNNISQRLNRPMLPVPRDVHETLCLSDF